MRRLIAPLAAAVLLTLGTAGALGAGGVLGTGGTARARAASAPPPPTATPTYHPALQLSATTGARDQALVMVASGFPPNGLVTVSWDDASLARGTTDSAGYLSLRAAVPHDAPDGPHEVRVVGPAHTAAGTAFTVAAPPAVTYHPALAASPAQVLPAVRLVALASGFPPNGPVTLSWDGVTLAHATADDSGAARLDTAIPTDATVGPHELRVVGPAHTTASAPVAVLDPAQVYHPTLTLDAAQGQRGTRVSLAAVGFAPDQDLHLSWDRVGGTDLGTVRTDANGNANETLTIGQGVSVTDGAHRLAAASAHPTLAASAFYTVLATPPPCGGLEVPLPFVSPLCIDPVGWLGASLSDLVHHATAGLGTQVASALVAQQDYTQVGQLQAAFGTTQQLARDLFVVLFLAGALTWYARRLGLGPAGEAATQMVEGGLGLAVTTALPWLLHLYIGAVNDASRMILANPARQGSDAIATLMTHLITASLLDGLNPLFLGVIGGFVLLFFVLLVLIVITRIIGLIYAAAVYLAAPLCVVCMVSPLTRGVARAWARLWFSLTLWGVSYAVALAAVSAMLDDFATNGLFNGGLQSLAEAIAGILVIYGAPRLGDALLGGGASHALGIGHVPLLANAINYGVGAALGGLGGSATAAAGERTGAAIPSDPVVTPLPNASVSEVASIAPPINAEWGLIE